MLNLKRKFRRKGLKVNLMLFFWDFKPRDICMFLNNLLYLYSARPNLARVEAVSIGKDRNWKLCAKFGEILANQSYGRGGNLGLESDQ